MRLTAVQHLFIFLSFSLITACANISHPTGGDKDVTPPKLLSVTPDDSLLNTRVTRIEMRFDEFVNVSNAASEVQVAPLLPFAPSVEAVNKRVIVKIADSLLNDNTTYRITFGNAIGDVHENNPFTGYSYIFSTGSYFDSLQLSGRVFNAATGVSDTAALVLLYDASKSDSVVVKEKPLYATKTDGAGYFHFDGLPDKEFRLFALQDANNNLIYDGDNERIAFIDQTVFPKDSMEMHYELYLFSESDSVNESYNSSSQPAGKRTAFGRNTANEEKENKPAEEGFLYTVKVDTADLRKRSQDIAAPLEILFNRAVKTINPNRVNLSFDSLETSVEAAVTFVPDTADKKKLLLQTAWKENTVYTLRLLKNFAIDSAGVEAMPSKHIFRSKNESDYAKLHVHVPGKYAGSQFVFVLLKDGNIFYQQPVKDTNLHFYFLQPADYTMRIIADKNENGKWDRGKLLDKVQPEKVIPHNTPVTLKAGWENIVDFEEKPAERKSRATSPGRRVAPR